MKQHLAISLLVISHSVLIGTEARASFQCDGNLFEYSADGDQYEFWLREAPRISFLSKPGCNPSKTCDFKVTAHDFGGDQVIVEALEITEICTAFEQRTKEKENPHFETGDRTLLIFKREEKTQYILKDTSISFRIVMSRYFNGSDDKAWGLWEGDEFSGQSLSLGIETIEVLTLVR